MFRISRLLTGKEGMGYGDFKLLAAAGWIAMLWGKPLARIYAF